jgi:hypothetical protein
VSLDPKQSLRELEALDFTGRAEAFVESRFLTPLLACLGYEAHRDYEVIRHGDDGAAFKLRYPPVEKGAQRVKHYYPDYVPTIRKKMFWVIEAKSAKEVSYPFEVQYLVQGLQYCIHPEIQAKYLMVTNGIHSAVYDAHGAVFFDREIYDPILEFTSSDLSSRWGEIFGLLSAETLRARVENDLKAMYDKLCLSSLDNSYPQRLLRKIGASAGEHARQIEKHVRSLYLGEIDRHQSDWCARMEQLDAAEAFDEMDSPFRAGPRQAAHYFVEKSLAAGAQSQAIFDKLTHDFSRQPIFRKTQVFLALCFLWYRTEDDRIRMQCREFFDLYKDADLPLLNQVECALLRLTRKVAVLSVYPALRQQIQQALTAAPELIRFVHTPTALNRTYPFEILYNRHMFAMIKDLTEEQLKVWLMNLLESEAKLEDDFRTARSNLPQSEHQLGGFETYGVGGKHYMFKTLLIELNIDPAAS